MTVENFSDNFLKNKNIVFASKQCFSRHSDDFISLLLIKMHFKHILTTIIYCFIAQGIKVDKIETEILGK